MTNNSYNYCTIEQNTFLVNDDEDLKNEVIPSKKYPDAAPAPTKKRKFSTRNDNEDHFSDDSSIPQASVGNQRKTILIEAGDSFSPGEDTAKGSRIVPKQKTKRGPGRPKKAEFHQEHLPTGIKLSYKSRKKTSVKRHIAPRRILCISGRIRPD